jgi:hypothetical protein
MHDFEGLILDAAIGKVGAWDRLAAWLRRAMEEVVRGMLNPPTEPSICGIATEVLQKAQGELQRMGYKVSSDSNAPGALSRALGFPKKPLVVAFEWWLFRLAVMHCHQHYKPWQTDFALRQLHRYQGAVPSAELLQAAMRECLARLSFPQRVVLVLRSVGSIFTTQNFTFPDVAAIVGWRENNRAAAQAQKVGRRGRIRIKQILAQYEYT